MFTSTRCEVVSNERVRRAVEEIAALSTPGGVEMEVFLEIKDAEMWLEEPLTRLV